MIPQISTDNRMNSGGKFRKGKHVPHTAPGETSNRNIGMSSRGNSWTRLRAHGREVFRRSFPTAKRPTFEAGGAK